MVDKSPISPVDKSTDMQGDTPSAISLLPCPFCGVVPVIERCADTHDRDYGPRRWWGVCCRSTLNHGGTCAVEIRPQASIEAAAKRWNMRAPAQSELDELRREVERLTEEAKDIRARWNDAEAEFAAGIATLTKERDAAFAMSRCECSADEACPNLAAALREVEALRADRDRLRDITFNVVEHALAQAGVKPSLGMALAAAQAMELYDAAIDTARASTDEGVRK